MTDAHVPSAAWAALGERGGIAVHSVEVRTLELSFLNAVQTARGVHRRRPVVLVRIFGTGRSGAVEGWGECAALADDTYDTEDVSLAEATLVETLVPQLSRACHEYGGLPAPINLRDVLGRERVRPLSFAALEMAVADAHLRDAGQSLADLIGSGPGPLPAGAVVGQFDRPEALVERVDGLVDAGFTRVKLKVGPSADVGPVQIVRRRYPELLLQADANESYAGSEEDVSLLKALDGFDLLCIEQPFPRADLAAHARLAARIDTPICLDESLTSPEVVVAALAMEACSVVCVKPARLGGIGAALEVVDHCRASGVPLWIGGMFETGFARQVNAAVASLSGFAWPGDLAPASSYLAEDLVWRRGAAPTTVDQVEPGQAEVFVPRVPGVGHPPDIASVERLTRRVVSLPLDR